MDTETAKPKRQCRKGNPDPVRAPDFVTKHELAYHLGCHPGTIARWIRDGVLPGPMCRPGGKHPIWLRKHYEAFCRTGEWPREAYRHHRSAIQKEHRR